MLLLLSLHADIVYVYYSHTGSLYKYSICTQTLALFNPAAQHTYCYQLYVLDINLTEQSVGDSSCLLKVSKRIY